MKLITYIPRYTIRIFVWLSRIGRLAVLGFLFYIAYALLLNEIFDGSAVIYPILAIWIISAYIAIPWFHRMMTRYYLPNYFVGRIRSSDGLFVYVLLKVKNRQKTAKRDDSFFKSILRFLIKFKNNIL